MTVDTHTSPRWREAAVDHLIEASASIIATKALLAEDDPHQESLHGILGLLYRVENSLDSR